MGKKKISVSMLPILGCTVFAAGVLVTSAHSEKIKKIPVILDTDIGDDIDDTWALSFLLRSPELDLKLVVGDKGRCEYRAKLIAKLLENAGRTDVPVGVGAEIKSDQGEEGGQAAWVQGYDLGSYPGRFTRMESKPLSTRS